MNDLISIILPIYNMENSLPRCLQSIVVQTYKNLEIILIDDGSKDKSLEICQFWASKDSRIKVVSKENGGVSSARNLGIKISTGKYLCFIDPDDTIEYEYVDRLYSGVTTDNILFSACGYNRVIKEKKYDYKNINSDRIISIEQYFKHLFIEDELGASFCWNKMFKKESIIHLFDEDISFGEDLFFITTLLKENPMCDIYVCDIGLYNYYLFEDGLSKTKNIKKIEAECSLCRRLIDYTQICYPKLVNYAIKRYLKVFEKIVLYCPNLSEYKMEIGEARKFFWKIICLKEFSFLYKFCIFYKIFFPRITRRFY